MRTVIKVWSLVLVFALGIVGGLATSIVASQEPVPDGVVLFEPAQAAGLHPFTPAAVREAAGPFGGSGSDEVCDQELLIRFLLDNPDRLRAWAGVLDVDPEDVPDYIRSLTPTVLERNTPVTNHGFSNGRAFSFQAVLEAGTAVLVDDDGNVVVRCRCGNPIKPKCPDCGKETPKCPDEPRIREDDEPEVVEDPDFDDYDTDARRPPLDDDEDCPPECPEDEDEESIRGRIDERHDRDEDCDPCPPDEDDDTLRRTVRGDIRDEDDECLPCPPEEQDRTSTSVTVIDDDECPPPCPTDEDRTSASSSVTVIDDDECPPVECPETPSVHGYDDCPQPTPQAPTRSGGSRVITPTPVDPDPQDSGQGGTTDDGRDDDDDDDDDDDPQDSNGTITTWTGDPDDEPSSTHAR